MIRESESDRLMQNLTNVRITVDTEITDYNNRALGSEEAHYSSLAVDESIKVTATGRQTDVGKSINTYTIDWGTADRSNYEVSEDLGTLTVTPASATITTGSSEKAYDGTPLTNSEASISGLVNGETATVTATGSITNVGIGSNTCMVEWKGVNPNNYEVKQELGTLTVKPVEIVLIQDCAFGVAGNVTIESYGLKVQVSDVNTSYYDVPQMGENRWWLQFAWGDKIEVQIVVVTDETSYTITPVYDFVLGDSGNYKINTVDATGEFDVSPVAPLDGFGMGKPAAFTSVADRSLAEISEIAGTIMSNQVDSPDDSDDEDDGQQDQQNPEEETSVKTTRVDETIRVEDAPVEDVPIEVTPVDAAPADAAPAPAESAPAELSQEAGQTDEDAPDETLEAESQAESSEEMLPDE